MGWLGNFLRPVTDTANTIGNAAGQIPKVINGGRVSLGQVLQKTPAALETVGIPLVKAAADATGTVGSWSPIKPVSNFWKGQMAQTNQALDSWAASAHKELGVTNNDSLVKSADLIPKGVSQAVELESGAGLGGAFGKLAEHLVQAGGLSKAAIGSLGSIAVDHPQLATTLAKYITNPETDSNMFKATWDAIKNGKGLENASKLRLARATGAAVGGSTGYNTLSGAEQGKTGKKTALTAAEGVPLGLPIEAGIDGAGLTVKLIPKVATFLKEAINSTKPEVKTKMQDLTEHFVSDVHTPTEPTPIVHDPNTPLSEINPGMMNAHQQAKAEQDHNLINANRLVQQQQVKQAAVHGNGLQPLPVSAEAKIAELKAKQGAYTEDRTNGLTNNPAEQAVSDRNAARIEADMKAQQTPPAEKPMLKNQTGSAQENQTGGVKPVVTNKQQGDQIVNDVLKGTTSKPGKNIPTPKPSTTVESVTPTVRPQVGNPDVIGRTGKLTNGQAEYNFHTTSEGEHQIATASTGEIVHEAQKGGDTYTRVHNQLLDRAEAYGKGNRDPVKILSGRQKSGSDLGALLEKQIKTDLPSLEDRQLLSHHLEDPSIKLPEHIQRVADRVKPIRDLALHVRQANHPEVRSVEHYLTHVVKQDMPKKTVELKGSTRRVSTNSGSNKGRVLYRLENVQTGIHKVRSIADMKHLGGTHYEGKGGAIYEAHPATIKDLQKAGHTVEDDSAKILGKYVADTNRVKENAHFIETLKNDAAFKDHVIAPGQKLSKQQQLMGYRTVNVKGLEGYRMPNKLAFQIEGAMRSGSGTNVLLKGWDKANEGVTRTIFYNMITHPLNMLTNFGVGSGSLSKFGPAGTIKALAQLKPAFEALSTKNEDYIRLQNAGMHFGGFGTSTKPSILERIGNKVANEAGAKVGRTIDKANLIKQWYRANSKVIGVVDDHLKAALALAKEKQGYSLPDAVKLTDKFMVDYGNSTAFEKKVVSRVFNFAPWVKGNLGAIGHLAAHPVQNAGAITNLAIIGATWYELQKEWKNYTGNDKASLRLPGMLGIGSDVIQTGMQLVNKKVPTSVISHLSPIIHEGITQATGKDPSFGTPLVYKNGQQYTNADGSTYTFKGKDGKDQNNRITHAASNLIAPTKPFIDIGKEKKSGTEFVLNQVGLNTPHASNQKAAPKIGAGKLLSGINTVKGGSQDTYNKGQDYKTAGGNQVLAWQLYRANGDHSMDTFFSKNPQLDPLNKGQFNGYLNQDSATVKTGKTAFKDAGGSSLAYMQALKLSGSSEYDNFFKQNPQLDPTSPSFQGMKKSGSSSSASREISFVKSSGKNAVSRAKGLATPIKLKHTSASTPGLKKTYSTHPKATKVSFAKVKAATPPKSVKLVDSKALIRKATNPRPIKLKA